MVHDNKTSHKRLVFPLINNSEKHDDYCYYSSYIFSGDFCLMSAKEGRAIHTPAAVNSAATTNGEPTPATRTSMPPAKGARTTGGDQMEGLTEHSDNNSSNNNCNDNR